MIGIHGAYVLTLIMFLGCCTVLVLGDISEISKAHAASVFMVDVCFELTLSGTLCTISSRSSCLVCHLPSHAYEEEEDKRSEIWRTGRPVLLYSMTYPTTPAASTQVLCYLSTEMRQSAIVF
jgi:hypothetical protein